MLGRSIGFLVGRLLGKRYRLAHANLQRAFGGRLTREERTHIIGDLLRLLGESFVESIIVNEEDIARNVTIENWSYVTDALKLNRGVIILAPHLGPWEVASYVLGAHLNGAGTIYKPLKNSYINDYLTRTRTKTVHLDLISSKNGLRPTLGKIRSGKAVVMLFDQNAGKEGIPATFFGRTASTYAGPATLALRTGCAVIPGYITTGDGFRRFRIVFGKPFPLITTGDRERDILLNTQQYNDYLEGLVREHPAQWFGWLHNRWKMPSRLKGYPVNSYEGQALTGITDIESGSVLHERGNRQGGAAENTGTPEG